MVAISVHADIEAAIKGLNALGRKQVPFATAAAVNDVAFQVQDAERAAIPKVFRNPRPFTQKSVLVDRATKAMAGGAVATVHIRPEVATYLDPYEFGGEHVLPGRALLNPKAATVDAFGQLPKGAARRLAARKDVFVGEVHGHWGFWQRPSPAARRVRQPGSRVAPSAAAAARGRLKLLISFGRNAPVHQHLQFEERGAALIRKAMPAAIMRALTKALASAR